MVGSLQCAKERAKTQEFCECQDSFLGIFREGMGNLTTERPLFRYSKNGRENGQLNGNCACMEVYEVEFPRIRAKIRGPFWVVPNDRD